MNRATILTALAIFALGCAKDINNNEAVKQGVVDYLENIKSKTGLDMNRIDLEVTSVKYDKNEAHAVLAFKPKGMPSTTGMTKIYALERQGSKWVVKGGQESGMSPHGASGMPGAEMPPPFPGSGQLPPNHPPVGAQPGAQK